MRIITRFFASCLSAYLLTACTFRPLPAENAHLYRIDKASQSVVRATPTSATLLVALPAAVPPYTNSAMIYMNQPHAVNQYIKNRWVASPARMLQPLFVAALEQSHRFHAVVSTPFAGHTDWRLDTEILTFEQDFIEDAHSVFKLNVRAELIDMVSHRVVATRRFLIKAPAERANPKFGAFAANDATAKLLQELVVFAIQASDAG